MAENRPEWTTTPFKFPFPLFTGTKVFNGAVFSVVRVVPDPDREFG